MNQEGDPCWPKNGSEGREGSKKKQWRRRLPRTAARATKGKEVCAGRHAHSTSWCRRALPVFNSTPPTHGLRAGGSRADAQSALWRGVRARRICARASPPGSTGGVAKPPSPPTRGTRCRTTGRPGAPRVDARVTSPSGRPNRNRRNGMRALTTPAHPCAAARCAGIRGAHVGRGPLRCRRDRRSRRWAAAAAATSRASQVSAGGTRALILLSSCTADIGRVPPVSNSGGTGGSQNPDGDDGDTGSRQPRRLARRGVCRAPVAAGAR